MRLRVDGSLNEITAPPQSLVTAVIARVKVLAKMDIAEKRKPQDGAIALKTGDKRIDVRASTVPTINGEKVVLRVLDKSVIPLELSGLGLDRQQVDDLSEAIRMPHGLMLVTGVLIYPAILILVALLVVTIMLWFVVPTFADMFEEMGAELPSITLFVIGISDFILSYGIFIIGAIAAVVFAFRHCLKTDTGRRRIAAIGLATPVVGELMVQSAMYRFSNNLGLMLKSGVPILETLSALATVFRGSPVYQDAILHARGRVAAGRPLADSLEETGYFTTMITNTIHIGEESGQLAMVMEQISPFYKEKMQDFLSRLTKLLEPVIIVAMGGAMTVLMLSIYMPMFEMAGKVN